MPSNLPPRVPRLIVRTGRSNFPYIMVFILCVIIVIFGTKPRPVEDPSPRSPKITAAP